MSRPDGGPTTKILVSAQDRYLLHGLSWMIGSNGYVYQRGGHVKNRQLLLHRIITGAQPGQEVHHLNGNKLDNRRGNLTLHSASEHQEYHKHIVIARNRAKRKYPLNLICPECHKECAINPNHRGRNRFCSKLCGNRYNNRLRRKHG